MEGLDSAVFAEGPSRAEAITREVLAAHRKLADEVRQIAVVWNDAMSGARRDVLQADLSDRDQAIALVGDAHFPELL